MKKIMIILIILLIATWPLSIAKAEFLSVLHANEFKGLYSQTHMIGGHPKPKVLKYSPDSAKIYYVNKDGGDVLWFEKREEQWKMKDWDTVWARGGSADGCVWPYIFDCFVNTSPLFANNPD